MTEVILLDTNIYGWALERKQVAELLAHFADEKLLGGIMVMGSEVVRKELERIPHKDTRNRAIELYRSVVSGEIRSTERVASLAEKYFAACKERRARITIEDCLIVAAASLASVTYLITDNRETMRGEKARGVFSEINRKEKLKTPIMVSSDEAIRRFSFSSGYHAFSENRR